ncbi:hypothetical protein SDC9_210227 [bioreactor metagenome]|uniref:Uncharacterized protein n=1 Tax=bioreactor metagenome TaxID=1076179 RepID=A0A645JFK1_9ZZZZ
MKPGGGKDPFPVPVQHQAARRMVAHDDGPSRAEPLADTAAFAFRYTYRIILNGTEAALLFAQAAADTEGLVDKGFLESEIFGFGPRHPGGEDEVQVGGVHVAVGKGAAPGKLDEGAGHGGLARPAFAA